MSLHEFKDKTKQHRYTYCHGMGRQSCLRFVAITDSKLHNFQPQHPQSYRRIYTFTNVRRSIFALILVVAAHHPVCYFSPSVLLRPGISNGDNAREHAHAASANAMRTSMGKGLERHACSTDSLCKEQYVQSL